jgi:hypothetical protein
LIAAPDTPFQWPQPERDGLKWYCAISAETLDAVEYNWRDMIRVAIGTALKNTRLRPHLIYDGPEDAFCASMRRQGAVVIRRRTSIFPELYARYKDNPKLLAVVRGAFLRLEIPFIEQDDSIVLYTDCDVMFLRDPEIDTIIPDAFGASSQFSKSDPEDMNSGVMLINVPVLRSKMPELMEFARRSLHLGLDQEILRGFFGTNYSFMDNSLNWKPYWGWNSSAQIVHFHGPKPVAVRQFIIDGTAPSDPNWLTLLGWNSAGYEYYTRLWFLELEALNVSNGQA